MSPKKRLPQHKGLPSRWRFKNGAYRYQVPPGLEHRWDGRKEFTLGKTLPEAYKTWAERVESSTDVTTISGLLDRYIVEVISQKKKSTARGQEAIATKLKAVFGAMHPGQIKPSHAYSYFDKRTAKTAAKREIEVLRHALTKAVRWGVIDRNPLLSLEPLKTPPSKKKEITDEQLKALRKLKDKEKGGVAVVQGYVELKLVTGLRRTDMLRLQMSDIKPDGIYVTPSKTENSSGAQRIIERTEAVNTALDMCMSARPVDLSPYIFCTRTGAPYIKEDATANGFESMWQRVMAKLPKEMRFAERSLRNKAGNDAESLEHARSLLAHADERTTRRFYRSRPERVKPTR